MRVDLIPQEINVLRRNKHLILSFEPAKDFRIFNIFRGDPAIVNHSVPQLAQVAEQIVFDLILIGVAESMGKLLAVLILPVPEKKGDHHVA